MKRACCVKCALSNTAFVLKYASLKSAVLPKDVVEKFARLAKHAEEKSAAPWNSAAANEVPPLNLVNGKSASRLNSAAKKLAGPSSFVP